MRSVPSESRNNAARSRRRLLAEVAAAAVVIAIPIGAAVATARPIANPPGRDELDVLTTDQRDLVEQRAQDLEESSSPGNWERSREERRRSRQERRRARQQENQGDS